MELLYTLSALVAVVSALIAIAAAAKCVKLSEQAKRQLAALSSMRGIVEATSGHLDSLSDQLRALRGKFYASRKNSEDDTPVDIATVKADLRKRVGLLPGRRP